MSRRLPIAMLLCATLVAVPGCRKKHIQVGPLGAPRVPANTPMVEEIPPPEVTSAPEEAPSLVIPPPPATPRPPRRSTPAAPEPAAEPLEAKPAPPRMAPRLSPAQQVQLQERTWQAISAAEKNLQAVSGRRLSPTQQDIEGKVRTFLAQAREALNTGDWVRALNLAEKAQLLSVELARSV
jgi:hypothetical protein